MWMNEEVDKRMGMNQEQRDEYWSTLTYYFVKMGRLDDKDQGLSKEELKLEVEKLLAKQEAEMKENLTADQYAVHQEIIGELMRSAYKRWGIE